MNVEARPISTPQHIAIIMDGSGRWALKRKLPRVVGHKYGVESARRIVKFCHVNKLPILTLFIFSSENWARPKAEVEFIMQLIGKLLQDELKELHANQVKLKIIGDVAQLDSYLQTMIASAERTTEHNNGLQLNLAINYGGKWDIIQAVNKAIQQKDFSGELNAGLLEKNLCLSDVVAPDLVIRTSGEQRLSNFLIWQMAYSEIFFTKTLWPDFSEKDMQAALQFYASIDRRFGNVSIDNPASNNKVNELV